MPKTRRPLQQVRRALLAASLMSAVLSLLLLALPLFALQLLESAVPAGVTGLILFAAGCISAVLVLSAIVDACRELVLVRAAMWLDHVTGQEIVDTSLALGITEADSRARIDAVARLRDALAGGRLTAFSELPWTLAGCLVVGLVHPLLGATAVCALLSMIVVTGLIALMARRTSRDALHKQQAARAFSDAVSAQASTLSAAGIARGTGQRWEQLNRGHVVKAYESQFRLAMMRVTMRMLHLAGLAGLLAMGAWLATSGEVSAGAAVAAALLGARSFATVEQVAMNWDAVADLGHNLRILKAHEASAHARATHNNRKEWTAGQIVISDATAGYPGQLNPSLHNVSMTIEPGSAIGIVGPRQSGKSALAALISGRLSLLRGHAAIDGLPIASAQNSRKGPPIGCLPNDPSLLPGTLLQNISGFGTQTDTAALEAAARVGIHDTISALPAGYGTEVGNDGNALPVRLKRAVALARAICGNHRIIVLDEPEIGLDAGEMSRLEKLIGELHSSGTTVVIATSQPSLLHLTDNLVVMANGRIQATIPSHKLEQARQAA